MKRSALAPWTTLALATATLTACAASTIDLPEPPMTDETEAIIAVYQSPTGTVDVNHIDTVLNRAEARLDELHLSWLPNLLADALVALENRLEEGDLPIDPNFVPKESDPRISAAVEVHRICKGWNDPPDPPDPTTNGTIDLTAVIGGSELRRDIWGTAANCHALVDAGDGTKQMAFIDGTLILELEGALPRQPGELSVLFLLNGRLETSGGNTVANEDQDKTVSIDFRIADGQAEFRLPVDDGDIIVTVGLTSLTLRGSNGTFTCELGSHACH